MLIPSDEELCARAREGGNAGGSEAEQELARRYLSTVRSVTRPYYLAGGDSEDLTQEGMIGLLMAIRQFDPDREAKFRTFAVRCIRNRMLNVIKAASRQKHQPLEDYISLTDGLMPDGQDALSVAGPEDEFLNREADREWRGQLETLLSPLENRVLGDYLDGLSYRDIAHRTGRTEKSVDNAVQRIRKKLTEK